METRFNDPAAAAQATEEQMNEMQANLQRFQQMAAEQAKAADKLVREHPYQAIGIAVGLGLLIGLLAGRK